MRLRRIECLGFGRLTGTVDLDAGSFGLVVDRNEAGKSTLARAILASLPPPAVPVEGVELESPRPAEDAAPAGGEER